MAEFVEFKFSFFHFSLNLTASLYDIRFAQNVSTLVDNFEAALSITDLEVIQGNLTIPQPAMSKEVYLIQIPLDQQKLTSSMTFALRAADAGNRFGVISNVARATLRTFVPQSAPPDPSELVSVTPVPTEPETEQTTDGAVPITCPPITSSSNQQPGSNEDSKPTVNPCPVPKAENGRILQRYEIVVIIVSGLGACVVFVSVGCFIRKIYLNNRSAHNVMSRWGDPSGRPTLNMKGKTSAKHKSSAPVGIADIEDTF